MKLQLMKRTKDELKEFVKLYGLKGVSKLNKDALCDELMPVILKEAKSWFALFDEAQLVSVQKLLKEEQVKDCTNLKSVYGFLENIGHVEISKDNVVTMSEELKEKYKRYFEQKEANTLEPKYLQYAKFRKYTLAALHLYGMVEIDVFKDLYEKYEGEVLDLQVYFDWFNLDAKLSRPYDYVDGYLVAECLYLFEMQGFNELIQNTQGKSYYIPAKEEFLRYSDESYYEHTLHIERLKTHIKTTYKLDETKAEEAVFDLSLGQQITTKSGDQTLQHTLAHWNVMGISPKSMEEVNKLVGLVVKVMNTTRMWINKGFTPDEVNGVKSEPVSKVKFGRNEVCPCGSGKKYKKCCGK